MEELRVQILSDDEVIVSEVVARIWHTRQPREDWHGDLSLPQDSCLELGKSYTLKAQDGRSARILVNNILAGNQGDTTIEFVVDGAFTE